MRNIIFIINPIAGTRSKAGLRSLISNACSSKDIPFQIHSSVVNGDYSFLHPVINEQQVTDVVIAGGDGTVNQVIQSLKDCQVQFGILPCGSGNGLAFAAKISKNLKIALEIILNGKARPVDAFLVNDRFACMLCGLGFDARVAHAFARQKKRGLATYISLVIRSFFSATTYPFEITVQGRTLCKKAFFISVANSNQYGNHFTIAPKASLSDGLLDVVIAGKQSKLMWMLRLLKQISGKYKPLTPQKLQEEKRLLYFQTDTLLVRNPGNAPLHIDGEPAEESNELKIDVLRNCFLLIQPG